jgi:hypothetical protein
VKDFKNLIAVDVPEWAGIGAVRYIPDYLLEKLNDVLDYQMLKLKRNNDESVKKSPIIFKKFIRESAEKKRIEENGSISQKIKYTEEKILKSSEILNNQSIKSRETEEFEKKDYLVSEFMFNNEIEKYVKEIDRINEELIKKISAKDNAFSLGVGVDGMTAIKFGMVSEVSAIRNLANEVQYIGKDIEEASKVKSFCFYSFHLSK